MRTNILFFLLGMSVLSGCGQAVIGDPTSTPPPIGVQGPDYIVVKSRLSLAISSGGATQGGLFQALHGSTEGTPSVGSSIPITVVNSASSTMTLSSSLFSIPTILSQLLDFGFLEISSLLDNDLKVCGQNGNQKCGTALIRIYTTGTAGAGLYNSADGYGAPILAGQSSPLAAVGLNPAGAVVLQSFSIPNNKNVIRLTDFSNPKYNIKVDFSNAGAGSYSTTLVIEYALAP